VQLAAIIRTLITDRACRAGFWHVIDLIANGEMRALLAPARRVNEEVMANCPECDAEIEVDEFDVDKGDLLSCPECGSSLEVTGVSPIELDIAPDDDEEDDEDDEDELKDDDLEDDADEEEEDDEDEVDE
jgi:alpha-aminoadipate carrier protein LysW